jgi:parallel beta-helix repeat protein
VVSTTVAIEVVSIFKLPAPATPVARRGDPVPSSSDPAVVSPSVHVSRAGAPHPIRRRILAGSSIALLVAVAVAGSSGLRPRPAPATGVVPGAVAAPANADRDEPADAPVAAVPAATPARTGAVEGVTSTVTTVPYRWVATTGSDASNGSQTHPWRTIQHAVDVTPTGGVITVRGGTYAHFSVGRSGLVVQGASGETAIVSGSTYPVLVRGVTSATIRRLTIQNAPDLWGSGVRVEASKGVRIEGNYIRNNHSFGIKVKDATGVMILGNDISANDTGIELSGSIGGTIISSNRIHDNNRMVTSSRGGNGIVFTKTTGLVKATGNQIWGNRARHLTDSGYDGGAFEVYGASDLWITGNLLWNNNNVMETGTDGAACSRITFARNVAFGPGSVPRETQGLILRCASSSLFANNTFDGIDTFAFYVSTSGAYAGSIAGLRIENNVVVRGRAYSLGSGLPTSVVIDYNLALQGGSTADYANHLAFVEGRGNTDSLAEFRAWTGYDTHGLQADPRFVNRVAHDYRLQIGSPAIDRGAVVLTDTVVGAAPDIGRFESPG